MSSAVFNNQLASEVSSALSAESLRPVVDRALREARSAQPVWAAAPLRHRLKVLRRLRHRLAARPDDFTSSVALPQRRNEAETLAAEVLPLADACKWLEFEAPRSLAPRKLSTRNRPIWLSGVRATERRDPFGVVLILGTWNYPLFLVGVQTAQALAAGNAVLLKPGRDGTAAAEALRDALITCGLDPRLLAILAESPAAGEAATSAGVDKVVLTGSADTGRAVLANLADSLTPAEMELSGCDAMFVRGDADLDLVVKAVTLGMTLNGSATCVAPRRAFVHRSIAAELESRLTDAFAALGPVPADPAIAGRLDSLATAAVRRGALLLAGSVRIDETGSHVRPMLLAGVTPDAELLKADIFAPVLSLVTVSSDEEALQLDRKCPYALGATVFGRPEAANELATRIDAGCVVVNDFLIPTADPRVAFGGRRRSGYGVTRGAAGLLAMTQPKTVIEQTRSWRPYLEPTTDRDLDFFKSYLAAAHGRNWRDRVASGFRFLREAYRRQRGAHEPEAQARDHARPHFQDHP